MDHLVDPIDVRWTLKQLNEVIIYSEEMHFHHTSFMYAKDMSYFKKEVMSIVNHYNDMVSLEHCLDSQGSQY